jgi:hypothetical protein
MIKNSILDTSLISNFNNDIDAKSDLSQNAIANAFSTSNTSYNEASSMEDVLVNELLSMSSQINSIKFLYSIDNVTFVESFESLDFFDKKFHIDAPCALDIVNRTLTLPEKNVIYNKFISAIVEPGSNGTYGNSLKNFQNTDLAMIFDDSVTTMFEYEKFTNVFTAEPLTLTLTLKLEDRFSSNGLYVKLFSEEGVPNPTIEFVSVSSDGEVYKDIEYTYTSNQNDYFLRYLSQKTRYIRISFRQSYHQQITTDFGISFRYSIAIRQVQSVATEYSVFGEYVSVPLVSKNTFSKINFSSVDEKVRYDDILYYISANNGGKWIPIKNGEMLDLYSVDTGIPMSSEIDSIRVKIAMSKLVSGNFVNIEEILSSADDIYQLKSVPFNLIACIGGHITFGDAKKLLVQLDIPNTLAPQEFNQQCILDYPTKATVNLVPYYFGMEKDIEVRLNGTVIEPMNEKTDQPNFVFAPHTNSLNSVIVFNFTNTGLQTEVQGDGDVLKARKTFSVELNYKPFIYTREDAAITGSTIVLPYPSLYSDNSNINVEAIGFGDIPVQAFKISVTPGSNVLTELDSNDDNALVRVGVAEPFVIDNISIEDSWLARIDLNEFSPIFSYSMTPKFNSDGVQYQTPKSWTVYGLASMYDSSGVDQTTWHWKDVWVQIDNIKSFNWINEDEINFRVQTNCSYKNFIFVFTDSHFSNFPGDEIKDTFLNITGLHVNLADPIKLSPNTDFTLSADKKSIKIKDAAYSSRKDYKVTYYHGIDIGNLLPENITTSTLRIPGIVKTNNPTTIVAKYDYQNQATLSDIRYYSPICKEYRVTLI